MTCPVILRFAGDHWRVENLDGVLCSSHETDAQAIAWVRGWNSPQMSTERSVVNDATEKAIAVLTEIAEDEGTDNDTRVRAALGILGHAESVRQGHTAPV